MNNHEVNKIYDWELECDTDDFLMWSKELEDFINWEDSFNEDLD